MTISAKFSRKWNFLHISCTCIFTFTCIFQLSIHDIHIRSKNYKYLPIHLINLFSTISHLRFERWSRTYPNVDLIRMSPFCYIWYHWRIYFGNSIFHKWTMEIVVNTWISTWTTKYICSACQISIQWVLKAKWGKSIGKRVKIHEIQREFSFLRMSCHCKFVLIYPGVI